MRKATAAVLACLSATAHGQVLHEEFKFTTTEPQRDGAFGALVSVSGTTAIVGNWRDGHAGTNSGSAQLFDARTGAELGKLTASDAAPGELFGNAVGISGTTAIVGASGNDAAGQGYGAAYLFDTVTGEQLFQLTVGDDQFSSWLGASVAIEGTTAVVGAPTIPRLFPDGGSVFVFDTQTGQQRLKLNAHDTQADDFFGGSVGLHEGMAVIGARGDDDAGQDAGAAYLFDVISGQQRMKLVAPDAQPGDAFGDLVAIGDQRAVVGATGGSVYLFDTASGEVIAELAPFDHEGAYPRASSVALSDAYAVVGARLDSLGPVRSGLVYVYDAVTGQRLAVVAPSDGADDDKFGTDVALSLRALLVGAPGDDVDAHGSRVVNAGSMYVIDLSRLCPGDIADAAGLAGPDGEVGFGDFCFMLGLIGPCPGGVPGCTGDIADDFGTLNGGDGMVSFGDFLALLGLVGPCP